MASGLPVIATEIAGNEELVVDGETGRLVPAEDVAALREALRTLLTDAGLRAQMGFAARRRVEQSFTWMRVAEQYEAILRTCSENLNR
jgi:glycosyltransferase involved in cell wall biosynthesis